MKCVTLENDMRQMTGKQALAEIGKYKPCPHDNANTNIGTGNIWAKCDDCGEIFEQERWGNARLDAQKFEDAMARLNHLIL